MKWLLPMQHRTKRRSATGNERSDVARWDSAKFDDSTGQMYLETTATISISEDLTWARDCKLLQADEDNRGCDRYLERREHKREKRKRRTNALAEEVSNSKLECLEHMGQRAGSRKVETGNQKREDETKNAEIGRRKGARSLEDAAIECILMNVSDITLEVIECLPVSIVRRLWLQVNKRCSTSFNSWYIFSKILRLDDELSLDVLRYHHTIEAPNRRLDVYTAPLTSKSYEFITSLSVTTPVALPDLVKLSNVTNLGVLEIINAEGGENMSVGDRLIRAWHSAALHKSAFSALRILKLWNHEGLTTQSLSYLNSFPALAIYDVQGCGFDLDAKVEATRFGWKPTLETDLLGLLERACAERVTLMRTNLGMEVQPAQVFCSEYLWHGAKVKRIPRGDMPTFFTQLDSPEVRNPKPNDPELMKAKSREQPKNNAAESWDVQIYRAYARIGELRNDTDLARADETVGDQAVVGRELVNSVPMVSLRLGKSPSWSEASSRTNTGESLNRPSFDFGWKEFPKLATSTKRGLAFIRIKISPASVLAEKDSSQFFLPVNSQSEASNRASPSQSPLLMRLAPGIGRKKKRKLDDVLTSFL